MLNLLKLVPNVTKTTVWRKQNLIRRMRICGRSLTFRTERLKIHILISFRALRIPTFHADVIPGSTLFPLCQQRLRRDGLSNSVIYDVDVTKVTN